MILKKLIQKPTNGNQISDNPLLLHLEEKKELIKPICAGKPASSVPTVKECSRKMAEPNQLHVSRAEETGERKRIEYAG